MKSEVIFEKIGSTILNFWCDKLQGKNWGVAISLKKKTCSSFLGTAGFFFELSDAIKQEKKMTSNEYDYFEFKDRPTKTKSDARRRSCLKILTIIRRYVLSLDLKKNHGCGDILIIEDVSTHTKIQKHEVRRCLNILSKEGIVSKQFDFDRYDETGNPNVFSIAFDDIKWDGSKWVKIKYNWVKSIKGNNYTRVEKGIKTKWNGRGYTILFDSYEYKSALVLELATHETRRKSNFVCKRCRSVVKKPKRKRKHGHSIEKCNVSVVKNILEM